MAVIDASYRALNDMERGVAAVAKTICAVYPDGREVEDGDIVYLGSTGDDCVINELTMLIVDFFPSGTTLDLGYFEYETSTFTPIVTGIAVGDGDTNTARTIPLDIPTSGNCNPDGSIPYSGSAGPKIWGGTAFAVKVNGAPAGQGEVLLVIGYNYYGNKQTGAYVSTGVRDRGIVT